MAQIGKISEQVQLKCCGEKFYEFLKCEMDSLPKMFPQSIQSYEIMEANDFSYGSIIHWKYNFGCPAEAKLRLHKDNTNKTIILEFLEGDICKEFDIFQMKGEVIDGWKKGISSVKWTVEFVTEKENVNPPYNYLQFGVKASKGLDAYICNNLTT